ncbi:multidrug resistance-associated 7 [Pelobates cultripes]|uniref:Multidrug resistance-associated 7 n=1 Tax=Pelobates cultripes TaxID=61616 RepID=A0AAD1VX89_PELCU|nr:multidrug resistance-associated 7 [Pelobates cultripes]
MEEVVAQLCGSHLSDPLPLWVQGNIGVCFNQLILSALPHTLLAVTSGCHAGAHRYSGSHPPTSAWTCRVAMSFFLAVFSLSDLVLGAVFPRQVTAAVEVLSGSVSCLSWFTHFLALLSLQRSRYHHSRGPLSFLLPVPLQVPSLVISMVWICQEGAVTAPLNPVLVSRFCLLCLRLGFITVYLGAYLVPPTHIHGLPAASINDDDDQAPLLSSLHYPCRSVYAEDGESWWSRFFYLWINPLMQRGAKGDLKCSQDVYPLPQHLCTANVCQRFQSKCFSRNLGLLSSLNASFGVWYYSLGLLKLGGSALGFMGPLLLNLLVNFMETGDDLLSWGILYTMGLFASGFLGAVLQNQFTHEVNKVMLAVRAAVLTSIYHKAVRGEGTSLATFSPGEVVNFMSTDTDRISNFCRSFHELWSLPLQFSVTLFLLYQQVGVAFLGGLGLAVLLVPLNKVVANRILDNNQEMLKHKDTRVKLMTELLSGMRVVKFYTWESHFASRVNALREQELRSLRAIKLLDAVCVYLWAALPVLISIITFITYVLLGHQLTAAKVFTALALIGMLILPLNNFPWVLNGVLEAKVSLDRIQRFLELPEQNVANYYNQVLSSDPLSVLAFDEAEFVWGASSEVVGGSEQYGSLQLFVQDLSIQKGSLVGVVGKVGCGKSSLLAAITGELNRIGGKLFVSSQELGFGYTAQEPWIQFATIRDNILFGKDFNGRLYQDVLEACALTDDLSILPAGDHTEVGENGVTLSGGQKARVALARAVYQEKDIYILDDPLAAVDADVAAHLMDKCIMGILRHRTRILCSHRTELLCKADVVVLVEDGKIICSGPPTNVLPLLENTTQLSVFKKVTQEEAEGTPEMEEEADEEETTFKSHVLGEEEKKEGAVALQVYGAYWKAVGAGLAGSVLLALLLMQASRNVSDWWLSHWISSLENSHGNYSISAPSPTLLLFSSVRLLSPVFLTKSEKQNSSVNIKFYLSIYGGIAVANSVFTALRAILFALGTVHAAKIIHQRLLKRVLKATVTFFDSTPIGRIINRFSSDLYCIDDSLPFILNIFLANVFGLLGMLVVISYGLPWILLALVPLALLYYHIQRFYRYTSRELKRLYTITLSPIYTHFSETLSGLTTIRAMRHTHRFEKECETRLEWNQRCQYAANAAVQWLDIRLQMIGVMVVTAIAVIAIIQHQMNVGDPGLVGLALSYALSITGLLSGFISSFTQTEAMMVSVERAEEYASTLPSEPADSSAEVESDWPSKGCIEFRNVILCYRQDLPNALDGVSFTIHSGEKIGIVGRTGSGKSSIFLALFRMMEINSGVILIDNLPTRPLNLDSLRSRLAIIPQDAFLFSGSVRENLDPMSRHSDVDLHDVLEQCHLRGLVSRIGGLDADVGDRGKNFSLGQRQLLCLARALLTQAKILCIDEATASVDHQTDKLLQQTIRNRFRERTVLTIAHRLNTILDSDRVLVMHAGKVAELDSPTILCNKKESRFYQLIQSGQI